MKYHPLKREIPVWFTMFVAVVTLLTFTLNMINGRFWLSDFKVYYSAAQQLLSGGDVYLQSFDDGSGYYKYSPVVLYFFLPYTLLSFNIASVIHFFFLGFTYWYAFIIIRDLLKKSIYSESLRNEQLVLILSFICILLHFSREMFLGNINIVMLLFCSLSLRNYLEGKHYTGGLFLGLVILTKPFFIILLIPLLLRKQWRSVFGLAVVLLTGMILPFLYPGPARGLALYADWYTTIMAHDASFPGMNSVYYLLQHYLFQAMPGYVEYVIILVTYGAVGCFILCNLKREKSPGTGNGSNAGTIIFEWFFLIALLPSMLKNDWVQFVLSAPMILYIIFFMGSRKKYLLIPVMLFVLFFFSANSDDLLGRQLSRKFLEMGLMGLSNLALLVIAMIMFLKGRSLPKS